ncbi:DUF4197 domain-containing protein [Sulfurospirillum sp.]|uniref:DUF4197 domain-containing protein n=1 Tax=Sulfurospirillum sp. TaxID=2053622 RepID=UPI002FDCA439
MIKKSLIFLLPLMLCASVLHDTINTATSVTSGIQQVNAENGIPPINILARAKESLSLGVNQAVLVLGKEEGFLNNRASRIQLPSSLKTVATVVENLGGKSYVDDFVKTMNAAATKAIPKTASILNDTIASMSIEEAQAIASGKETTTADYLKSKSGTKLLGAITPIVNESIKENYVMRLCQSLKSFVDRIVAFMTDNALVKQFPAIAKFFGIDNVAPSKNENLDEYIAQKTLDGLFSIIAEKEKALRSNPLGIGNKITQ